MVVVGVAAAGLVGTVSDVSAAPLIAPITRVGPATLTESRVLDVSADGRWVLAGNLAGGTVQRIDRSDNAATAPLTPASPDVALTDNGRDLVQVAVAPDGELTISKVNPNSGTENLIVVGTLDAGTWSRVGSISISANGRYVAFSALESTTGRQTVVVADTANPPGFVLADVALPTVVDRRSADPSVSADGRYVAFATTGAAAGCTAGPDCGAIWVLDQTTGGLELVSARAGGTPSTGVGSKPGISANGRFVAFVSDADDLVVGVTPRAPRVYVRDLVGNVTAAVPGTPTAGPFGASAPSVSDDGRLVAFTGLGQVETTAGVADADQVLVADLADYSLTQVPRRLGGGLPDGSSSTAFLRADGSEVVFSSAAINMLATAPTVPWNLYAARIGGPESAGSTTQNRTKFVPLPPFRVLDTRSGLGAPPGKPGPATTVTVAVGGVGAVPNTATAVALNVTATQATRGGFVTVFPAGTPLPLASNLNPLRPNQTIPNLVVTQLGTNDSFNIYTSAGTHLLADVLGYFVPSQTSRDGRYVALTPARVLDTRAGVGAPLGKPGRGATVAVPIRGRGGVPAAGVSAVVLNVTATQATAAGHVTVYPGATGRPVASNLNIERRGQTIPNLVIVPVGSDGRVNLYTAGGTHLIADVSGYFTDATAPSDNDGLFVPIRPVRIQDTRVPFARPLAESTVMRVRANLPPLPASDVAAAMLNVTATLSKAAGFLTIYPAGAPRPQASNLNVEFAGQTIPNAVVATLSGGSFDAFSQPGNHLIVDVSGYFRG
jgi:hypothetical protein